MSAETLRRAANLMRERAAVAQPGPWFAGNAPTVRVIRALHPDAGPQVAQSGARRADNTFPHIASWQPAVALAVADWLDHTADACVKGYAAPSEAADALAVSRAYLGSEPC